ncbi:MAG: hypothetical protein GY770_28020 [Aestuariibacter sp.]|nr:hypothetical protein [Aestuariibacter sp.]
MTKRIDWLRHQVRLIKGQIGRFVNETTHLQDDENVKDKKRALDSVTETTESMKAQRMAFETQCQAMEAELNALFNKAEEI